MIPFTEPVDVGDKRGLPLRVAVRLLIIDPQNRLLLFRCHPPGRPPVWAMAQGALPQAYGSIDDDVREVVARTGLNARLRLSAADLRDGAYAGENSALERWIVWTFVALAEGGEPGAGLWTPQERAIVGEHRWWSLDELRATTEAVHPGFLAELLSEELTSLGRFLVVTDGPMRGMRWYARIPPHLTSMGFVHVEPRDGGLGGLALVEHTVIAWRWRPGAHYRARPLRWAREHDVRNWRVFAARNGRHRVGGAVVAWDTPQVALLHGRRDRALLWDIRQDDQSRHFVGGIQVALFRAAAAWARSRGAAG